LVCLLEAILDFFKRPTNAKTESFKLKVKRFRANQRGVVDVKFFLFVMKKFLASALW
jgi:ABC-type microcin C transport system permease subunit YejE